MPIQLPIVDSRTPRAKAHATLRVGDLARRTGKTVRALHLYEELGLLEPVERSKGGYRLYDADSVARVEWISKLQDVGFSLSEIREVSRRHGTSGSAPSAMKGIESLLRDKLAEARTQITRLRTLERDLQASLEYLETCPTCDPKRIVEACSACDLHEEQQPDLLAGFTAH